MLPSVGMRIGGVAALLVLAGCGGGGGGGGGSSSLNLNGGPAALSDPGIGTSAAAWFTSEYLAGRGLNYINAAQGYAARIRGQGGGKGVRVGIIDSGVRLDHQDLIVAENYVVADGEPGPTADDHGTHVAGIVAAQRNGTAVHGVAYNASIIGIQANAPVTNFLDPDTFTFSDLAYAIGSGAGVSKSYNGEVRLTTPAAESDILNMSLGGGATTAFVLEAMQDAAAAEKIMVIATGNDNNAQPDFPARDVIDAGVAGYGIAVGALDPTDGSSTPRASFSNACGVAANYCLFAPGVSILSTTAGSSTEFGFFSGTSMATPHVSGAAAVLMAAFPSKTPTEIVDRLLDTANDLGAVGVDAVYGHGALDLGAAMNPVGFAAIPAGPDGVDKIDISGTGMSLGAAFGMPADMEKLSNVLVLDEQDFPFSVDLTDSVQVTERESAVESFLSSSPDNMVSIAANPGERWSYSFAGYEPIEQTAAKRALTAGQPDEQEDGVIEGWSVGFDATPALSFTAASQVRHTTDTVVQQLTGQAVDLALDNDALLAPFSSVAGEGVGVASRFEVSESFEIVGGYFAGDGQVDEAGDAGLGYVGFNQALGKSGAVLSFTAGILDEDESLLGSSFSGGFGEQTGADTRFVELGFTVPVNDRLSFFGTASQGWSSVDEGSNAFSADWSTVQSSAFALGARMAGLFGEDQLTLTIGQPHRVDSASASLSIPTAQNVGGSITRSGEQLDFSADGRETVVQAVYAREALDGAAVFSGGVFGRFEPNHVADAEPEFGAAVRMTLRF